jgi:hypothetical protein
MKVIGFILSLLVLATITLGIWWTGLAVFVTLHGPTQWDMALLLLWGGASVALAFLLMIAVVKWGV